MLIPGNKRVSENAAIICRGGPTQTGFKSASPGGPAGSSLMTFACVMTYRGPALPGNQYIFSRTSGGLSGWMFFLTADTIVTICANSTPAFVQVTGPALVLNQPTIVVARYNNGSLQVFSNGVSVGTATLGTGFTLSGVATMVGTLLASSAYNANAVRVSECFMLDGYDVVASYNTSYGTGAAGLYAQWAEDLQQGRYLTCPRNAGVLGASDWYWSARDVVSGPTTKTTWTDRGLNAVALTKSGSPQGCSVTTRFA